MKRLFSTKRSRILALVLAASIAVSGLAVGLGATLAAKPSVELTIAQPNNYTAIDVGNNVNRTVSGARRVASNNTARATASMVRDSYINIVGVSAGPVVIAASSSGGAVVAMNYQIRDNANIGALSIKNGAEYIISSVGKTVSALSLITVDKAASSISWKSMQPAIATIENSGANKGLITGVSKGAAVIVGEFTDIWGTEHNFQILVGVGVSLGDSILSDLMEWVNKGEGILALDPNPYTSDSLNDLQTAVNEGIRVLDIVDPTDAAINNAINGIKGAIDGLDMVETGGPDIIGPDTDGNYYRELGEPENIFEVVDEDGNSQNPPKYIYNPTGDPVSNSSQNTPAIHPTLDDPFWRIEHPAGSNIWQRVKSDGTPDKDNAIWGGGNGQPGGGDDLPAKEFGSRWWIDRGQNVWQEISMWAPTDEAMFGVLTGGGLQRDPSLTPGLPVFDNTYNDGRYYIGPLGPDSTGHNFYYGDPKLGGNGYLDSVAAGRQGDDVKYYYNSTTGTMDPDPPVDPPVDPPIDPPVDPSTNNNMISTGGTSFFIRADGQLWGAGNNAQGQLADGTFRSKHSFMPIVSTTSLKFTMVDSQSHATGQVIALTTDGRVLTWGYNYWGQLGDGTTTNARYPHEIKVSGKTFKYVASGENNSAAISTDGVLYTWGYNGYGQIGNGSTYGGPVPNPYPVSMGPAGTKVAKVSIGDNFMVALTEAGEVYAWGLGAGGRLGQGNTSSSYRPVKITFSQQNHKIKDIAANSFGHGLALTVDGDLYAWGVNSYGQVGDGTTSTKLSPVQVMAYTGLKFASVETGHDNSWAITTDGRLFGWGYNGYGLLALGDVEYKPAPFEVTPGITYTAVAASEYTTMAIRTDGSMYIWGYNGLGQFGNGTVNSGSRAPVRISIY